MSHALVLGATGALGAACCEALVADGHDIHRSARAGGPGLLAIDPIGDPSSLDSLRELPPLSAVVWAQGANVNDDAASFELDRFRDLMDANVGFVLSTLRALLDADRLVAPARLVVISSIWEQSARAGKLSYTISKAAVGGLVRALSADLAPAGHLVNGVLPSVTDTPMTRRALSEEQLAGVVGATAFGRLVTPQDVAAVTAWLCSPGNGGVTGQSVLVDLGFGHVRRL